MAIAYGIIFALSLLMPPLYFVSIRKKQKEPWLFILFICISIVNLGYLLLSISKTETFALWANKITYLGQVFVPVCMFLLISKLCGFQFKKKVSLILIGSAIIMFAIVFTTGWLDWYYVDVTLKFSNGGAYLEKEYGLLHPTNLIYVISHFIAMFVIIGISLNKSKGASQTLAGLMLAVVLCNIGMWILEKIISWNFELLSISYLMSESVFFFVYLVLQDYIRINDLHKTTTADEKSRIIVIDTLARAEKIQAVLSSLPEETTLSPRQIDVLEGILDGKSRKEIASDLHLSENTVKMHISSLYKLLGISKREELFALLKTE